MADASLKILEQTFSIHRFPADAPLPEAVAASVFYWVSRTPEELSVVCEASIDLGSTACSGGWACLKVEGPLDFSEVGILSRLSHSLAGAGISIFALSTFDTDYVLLPSSDLQLAREALVAAGYTVAGTDSM